MLKGWIFEAVMAGVVIVMLGQMLDQSNEVTPPNVVEPTIEIPRA